MNNRLVWLFAAVAVLLAGLAYGTRDRGSALLAQAGAEPANAIHLTIANSSTKEMWLHQAAEAFSRASRSDGKLQVDGKPVVVDVVQETVDGKKSDYRSGTMVT